MAFKRFSSALLLSALLVLVPQAAPAQTGASAAAADENELIAQLIKSAAVAPASVAPLLKENRRLVTPSLWEKLMARAGLTYYYDPAGAFVVYGVAQEVAAQLGDKQRLAVTYYNVGRSHSGLWQTEPALTAYLASKQCFEEAGLQRDIVYVLADLGALSFYAQDYTRARLYSEQSIELADRLRASDAPAGALPDDYGVATAHSTLGNISFQEGRYDSALASFQKALALYEGLDRQSGRYRANLADVLAGIGRVYTMTGDHQRALTYLHRALELVRAIPLRERVAGVLNNLGNLYMEQGNYERAIQFFTESLEIHRESGAQEEVARAQINIGLAHLKDGNYSAALDALGAGLKTAEEKSRAGLVIVAAEGIAAVHERRGEYEQALRWLERSSALARATRDHMREAESAWLKAEALLGTGDVAGAAALATDASQIADRIGSPAVSYLASTTLGKAHLRRKDYASATRALTRAIQTVETLRDQVAGREQERALFFEEKLTPYHLMVEALVEQGRMEEALAYVERAKGRVLSDVLKGGKVDVASSMTPQERAEERRLNQTIIDLNRRLAEEGPQRPAGDTAVRKLEAELNAARLKYEHFQNLLSASRPQLTSPAEERPPFALGEAAGLLHDGRTAILEYVVLPENVYLFVVTRGERGGVPDLKVYRIEVGERDLAIAASRFRKTLAERNPAFVESARRLYDLLVKPAEAQLKGKETLCLIPDGTLWDLPFQAVRSERDAYLLEAFSLYYAPSVRVLAEIGRRRSKQPRATGDSLVAFGNPFTTPDVNLGLKASQRTPGFPSLPDAEVEVATLGKIFGPGQSRVLVGRAATEAAFKQQAPHSTFLHLATHGVLDNRQPLYSYLLLAKADGDTENDGLLEAREIMQMELPGTELVVLSACDTARGKVGAGEGIIGMSWAFLVAGAETTVVSQWQVDSASTARLMVNYYRSLKGQAPARAATKASALRSAALSLINDPHYSHPFYWAGFVMVGGNR